MPTPRVLIIAGSDSGGGAGIQGDIKSVSANGAFAATAITSITVQNTLGVSAVFDLPLDILRGQIKAVLSDIGADVIKTGMLSSADIINVIAEEFEAYKAINKDVKLVIDPVMIAKGGAALLQQSAVTALKEGLIPKAFLVTPNIPEAEVLAGINISGESDMLKAAEIILKQSGTENVLLKGGHLQGNRVIDLLVNKQGVERVESAKIDTKNTHGTGCSMASAISAQLAKGNDVASAFKIAREYIQGAILNAPQIGQGHGPIGHFWQLK
jgi:hydroxymethylpyrimidine/phosphomethylpyrimidine kinase